MWRVAFGCAVAPKPLTSEQLVTQWVADSNDMFKDAEKLDSKLTFASAVARTLNYNLDKEAKSIEEALAFKRMDLSSMDELPNFVASAGYVMRDKKLASSSQDLATGSSGSPSFSMDQENGTADLGLTWNVLDFGLSYYQSKTAADRALIAVERRRKAEHELIAQVRSTYWRAVAYQTLHGQIKSVLAEAQNALSASKAVESENVKSPTEALRYQKSLLETMRQMRAVEQQLSTAPYELAALINVKPSTKFKLAAPDRLVVPHWTMPAERMTAIAFENNPDIHEQAYLSRIASNDSHSELIKALPGVGLAANLNYDSNSFMVDNYWADIGPRLSWNLIKFAHLPKIQKTSKLNEEAVKARRLAVRMAVLAQVYIAERRFKDSVDMYKQADSLYRVDSRLSWVLNQQAAADAAGDLERISAKASAIASQLRRFETYAQMQKAYGRLQQTLGRDLLPAKSFDGKSSIDSLTDTVEARLIQWDKGDKDADFKVVAAAVKSLPRNKDAMTVSTAATAKTSATAKTTVLASKANDLTTDLSRNILLAKADK